MGRETWWRFSPANAAGFYPSPQTAATCICSGRGTPLVGSLLGAWAYYLRRHGVTARERRFSGESPWLGCNTPYINACSSNSYRIASPPKLVFLYVVGVNLIFCICQDVSFRNPKIVSSSLDLIEEFVFLSFAMYHNNTAVQSIHLSKWLRSPERRHNSSSPA